MDVACYCCKFLIFHIENYFFLAANREVQLNNQFYKTTRELRTLFKNILERRRLRSANSLKKNIWDATATRELGKKILLEQTPANRELKRNSSSIF